MSDPTIMAIRAHCEGFKNPQHAHATREELIAQLQEIRALPVPPQFTYPMIERTDG
jgi:hypothetical protein